MNFRTFIQSHLNETHVDPREIKKADLRKELAEFALEKKRAKAKYDQRLEDIRRREDAVRQKLGSL